MAHPVQSWRLDVLERYMEAQKEHITAAYTGTISTTYAAQIMATIGIKGTGNIRHHHLNKREGTIFSTVYFDIGTDTDAAGIARNDSTIALQTSTRIYMVSEHRPEGAPLSMAEARIVAPVTAGCATLVHMQQGMYKVVQGGAMQCAGLDGGRGTMHQVTAGQTMHFDSRHTCNTTCIEIGPRPFTKIKKHMPEQPTVHHSKMLAGILTPKDNRDAPHLSMGGGKGHDTEHNILGRDIREAQDMLEDLHQTINNAGPDVGVHLGLAGTVCSLFFALLLLAILVRWRWWSWAPTTTALTRLFNLNI